MDYYYCYCSSSSSSSFSKKLMKIAIITLLLIITSTTFVAGEQPQGCSKTGPVDSGPCKGTYLDCVTVLLNAFIDGAPETSTGYTSLLYYPDGNPSGGVTGTAICVLGSYSAGCRNCLRGIRETLNYYCSASEGGYFYTQYCSIEYHQIP